MFAAPLWLVGLATLAIPLILHFWSRRPRQVIRVGSLRHVEGLAETRSWSARITEPLLLLVRLLLLATVVVALAGPKLGGAVLEGRTSQLVVVEPALIRDSALVAADPLLDSLARSRTPVRLLAPGLPKIQLDGRGGARATATGVPPAGSLWDHLLAADRLVAPGGRMLVIARPRVAALGGRRPALHAQIDWHVPADPPTARWRAARWPLSPDSVVEIQGTGGAHETRYQLRVAPVPCIDCPVPARVSILVAGEDSATRRRLHLAALAVGSLLGQAVEPAATAADADLVVAAGAVDADPGRAPVLSISPAVAASAALADTLLAHWPGNPLASDTADLRQVSLAQAMPALRIDERFEERNARLPLLLLALMLFAVERWLATRPRRRSA
ncbi:MAG: BatA domain-containing protein [Gemmatimonadales bacterium]